MRKLLLAILPALTLASAQAHAQSAGAFYHGKTVTYIVATAPGGGYDTYGRLIARYLGKYLGDAKVIVQNVPGAGHIVGADELYVARPDGLTIGTFNTGLIFAQLLKLQGVQFDLANMSWIGKASSDPRVLVLSKSSGIKNWQELTDASKPPFKFYVGGVGFGRLYGYQNRRRSSSSERRNHSRLQRQRRRDEHAARRDGRHDRLGQLAAVIRRTGQAALLHWRWAARKTALCRRLLSS